VGAGPSPDAIDLARRAGLQPAPSDVDRSTLAEDGSLLYRADARHIDQQRWVAQHLAGWLLRQQQLDDSPELIADTAAALLLPRDKFLRDAEETSWNLRALQPLYPNASMGTLALRIASLQEAVVTWFDRGTARWRSVAPAFSSELATPTRFEQNLAAIALETDTVLHPAPRVWAFPLNRKLGTALLVCDAQDLLARDK
jgi:hypothetical protein